MPYNLYPADTADLYDQYIRTGLRYLKTATTLVDSAGPITGFKVVDLGCGTGIMTRLLAEQVGPKGQVIGIDASSDMLAKAKQNTDPNTRLICAPAEELDRVVTEPIDAIFSNAAFWQFDRKQTLKAIANTLTENGKLYFNLSAGFFNFKASGMSSPSDDTYPYRQHDILAKWIWLARKRYPNRDFPAKTTPTQKPQPQNLTELSNQLETFGFEIMKAEPLRFEIPRDDEYNWLKIPQWTDRTLAPLSQTERVAILDEIFQDIPNDAKFLARWVIINATRKHK